MNGEGNVNNESRQTFNEEEVYTNQVSKSDDVYTQPTSTSSAAVSLVSILKNIYSSLTVKHP